MRNDFEPVFNDFVKHFGGEVLPPSSEGKTADYLFREQNIVAELKCLMEDRTARVNAEVTKIVQQWYRKHRKLPSGFDGKSLPIATAPEEIQDAWLKVLAAPVEDLIKKANRQIRETKKRFDLPAAKGVALIFNERNLLHSRPEDYKLLLAKILRKRTEGLEIRFPHIQGVVYFSFDTVKTPSEGMNFWAAIQLQHHPSEDLRDVAQFQEDLQQGWYQDLQKRTGTVVRQFTRDSSGHLIQLDKTASK